MNRGSSIVVALLLHSVASRGDRPLPPPPSFTESVATVVRQGAQALHQCHERAAHKDPRAAGVPRIRFTIGARGQVISASAGIADKALARCITEAIKRWRFPPPPGGATVEISYPIAEDAAR